jgi:hypothetical protein
MVSVASRDRFASIPHLGPQHRSAGVAATVLVHAALILAWQMGRTLPPLPGLDDEAIQWIRLPAQMPRPAPAPFVEANVSPTPARTVPVPAPVPAPVRVVRPSQTAAAAPAPTQSPPAAPSTTDDQATPTAASIMDSARRSVGEIDRALRKESKPTIVLPPDSPQIRLRRGIEHAHDMAPPRLWEAPKVVELVNNTGDGARRTRVITAAGTYCITERSPVTSIDMIEKHGKQRFTTCPRDEEPAKQQEWRTARD